MPQKNHIQLPTIAKGERITAQYLSNVSRAINRNTRGIAGPKNVSRDSASGASESTDSPLTDLTFIETSRSETTKQITDSNGDTHDINQIDQVVAVNAEGQVLTINFNNP